MYPLVVVLVSFFFIMPTPSARTQYLHLLKLRALNALNTIVNLVGAMSHKLQRNKREEEAVGRRYLVVS